MNQETLQETINKLEKAQHSLKMDFISTMTVFSNLLTNKNPDFNYNYARIADISRLIAVSLNLSETSRQDVYFAGFLHNLGQLCISAEISRKAYTELTEDQQKVYNTTPAITEFALLPIESLHGTATCIRSHRELLDGSGFPDKLITASIPLTAQILCVVTEYFRLLSGLEYKNKFSTAQAKDFLRKHENIKYNKQVVEVFIHIIEHEQAAVPTKNELHLTADQLQPGMILTQSLQNEKGMTLLMVEHELSEYDINKIKEFEQIWHQELLIHVAPTSSPGS
jgi:response regulator RpfG family c-di-GMP phosphodiesterase